MKKLTRSILLFVLACTWNVAVKAQNSSPFPSTGNVGIGTTSPLSPLDVRAGGASPGIAPLAIGAVANSSSSGFWFANAFSATQTAANVEFEGLSVSAITAHPAGTNVGTAVPGFFLCEHGGAGTITDMRGVWGDVLVSPTAGNVTNAECFYASTSIINSNTASGTITNGYGYYMAPFSSNVVNKYGFYINDATANNYIGGSLCIGTTTPFNYQLAVNGSAIFTQAVVKLKANWPDYVFKKGYALPSLDSLSAYIGANNHLPEMPSAEEVSDKGVDVGATEAVLLKKVEELTLYLIRQNDLLRAQQQEIDHQQQEIDHLKKKGRKSVTHSS